MADPNCGELVLTPLTANPWKISRVTPGARLAGARAM